MPAPKLPDVEELRSAALAARRRHGVRWCALAIFLTLYMIAVIVFVYRLGDAWENEVFAKTFVLAFIAASTLVSFGLFVWAERPYAKYSQLRCVHCGKWPLGSITITSGNCSHCGRRAVANPDSAQQREDRGAHSIEEFRRAEREFKRAQSLRVGLPGFLILFTSTGIGGTLADPMVLPVIWEPTRPWLAMTAIIFGFAALFAIGWRDRNLHHKFKAICCPHCRKHLQNSALVIATGNCPHCGRRVIKDEKHGT